MKAVFTTGIFTLVTSMSWGQSAESLRKQEEAIRENMLVISRQLGVDCTACHTTKNFKSNEKPEFKKALEHMKLTQLLIDHGMDGKNKTQKADCYLCHRGKLKPDSLEKFDPLTMKKNSQEKPDEMPENSP